MIRASIIFCVMAVASCALGPNGTGEFNIETGTFLLWGFMLIAGILVMISQLIGPFHE